MSLEFRDTTLYKALSIGSNDAASSVSKIVADGGAIRCQYCIARQFNKRQTDLTSPDEPDPTSPDTGTAMNIVELLFLVDRSTASQTVLKRLMEWFYELNTNTTFRRGYLGLLTQDNPDLDLKPIALAGYRLISFQMLPDIENPAVLQFLIRINFQGDHTELGAFP